MWKNRKLVGKLGIVKSLLYKECNLVGNRAISLFPSSTTVNGDWEHVF